MRYSGISKYDGLIAVAVIVLEHHAGNGVM
jgi:hypothetical protein